MASTDQAGRQVGTGAKAKVVLYWLEKSRAQRILWLLEELKVDYELKTYKRVNMTAPPELKNVHPLGKSPLVSIQAEGAAEPIVLAESGFIIEYLIDHFGPSLAPRRWQEGKENQVQGETDEWLRCRHLMHYGEGTLMPYLVTALLFRIVRDKSPFFIRPIANAIKVNVESTFLNPSLDTNFAFLESQVKSAPDGGGYLCGSKLTGADILMSFPLGAAKGRSGFTKEKYPALWDYVNRLEERDGFKKAVQKIVDVEGSSVAYSLADLILQTTGQHRVICGPVSKTGALHTQLRVLLEGPRCRRPLRLMPRGDNLGGNGCIWGDNELPSSSSTSFEPATDAIDFAYNLSNNNVGGWPRKVNPTGANRSGGMAARSVANMNLGNGNGNVEVDFDNDISFDWYSGQLQRYRVASPATAQSYHCADEDHLGLSGHQASFSHSIPTPPDITVYPPSGQSRLRDEAGRLSKEPRTQLAIEPTQPSTVTAKAYDSPLRETITSGGAEPTQQERQSLPASRSIETPPPDPAPKRGRPRKQKVADSRSDMSRNSLPQNDREKETPSQRKDGSLASSTHSVQSRSSFEFNRIDRVEGSPITPGISRLGRRSASQVDQRSLPDEKGFSIQIGAELFKLSGASIMSDGYLITPTDGTHFVKLFADAQFYRLPRLQTQLFESEIFVEVGSQHFHIPRDIFKSPGDTPNYFTLGFTVFFSSPGDVFPGLNPRGLLRPPAIHPPRIPSRSPQIFSDLLHMLRGYPLTIQNSDHRAQLLKDARYYNLRGLEQKIIPHSITHNIDRQVSEIVIRLQDIKPSQISLAHGSFSSPSSSSLFLPPPSNPITGTAYIIYARPYIDETPYHLILEVPSSSSSSEPLSLNLHAMRATLFGTTRTRITALFQTVANKLNLPTTMPLGLMMNDASARVSSPGTTPLSDDDVKVRIDADAHVVVNGKDFHFAARNEGVVESGAAAGAEEDFFANDWTAFGLPPPATSPLAPVDDGDDDDDDDDDDNDDDDSNGRTGTKRPHTASPLPSTQPSKRLKTTTSLTSQGQTWTVHRGQWRLRVQPRLSVPEPEEDGPSMEIVMEAVKIEATSGEKARNAQRGFLE
ncbi:MAG: hypothetical protein Q9210_001499 [Variospora velana]